MKQKSYQRFSTVATVVAVASTLVMAVLKLCGLLAFSWWLVMAPFLIWSAVASFAFVATIFFFAWAAKELEKHK